MQQTSVFHEDVFYEHFQPLLHPSAKPKGVWGGHGLETYGEDLQLAFHYDCNHVWTVVDGTEGSDQWIIPGFHHVNRVCFLLTKLPHYDAPIEFRVEHRGRSLTPIGLRRRLSTLREILAAHKAIA